MRQASESLKVVSQLSYLSATGGEITVSLTDSDASSLFFELEPIAGPRAERRHLEILRLSQLFSSTLSDKTVEYPATALNDIEESGFIEGSRVKRAHLSIERNKKIRSAYFEANPSPICDFCEIDTSKRYPWTPHVLDIHHILPLGSGSRTSTDGTRLDDLVANCPTCHRAVHRYYDKWLKENNARKDFQDAKEAKAVYDLAKKHHRSARSSSSCCVW